MIHPYTGNMISICNKFSRLRSDNRCIGSIYTDTAIIINEHPAYTIRVHHQQCQTVLPQITPASSTLAIIMMRQERAAIDSSKNRLEAYPVHELVKLMIPGLIRCFYTFTPGLFCLFICLIEVI